MRLFSYPGIRPRVKVPKKRYLTVKSGGRRGPLSFIKLEKWTAGGFRRSVHL